MARASSADSCLICAQAPCQCNAKKKAVPKKARPRVTASKTAPSPVAASEPVAPTVTVADRMRQRAMQAAAPEPREPQLVVPGKVLTREEAEFLPAIRLLNDAFDINPQDIRPWLPHLEDRAESVRKRASAWRERRDRSVSEVSGGSKGGGK